MVTADRDLRIGVIGLGIGQSHVRAIGAISGARVTAVGENYTGTLRGSKLTAPEYAASVGAKLYTDGVEMIESEDLDALSLCVSPKWRRRLLVAAVAKGVPVLVEKPWSTDLGHGQELARLLRAANLVAMVEFPLRFLPPIQALRGLLHAGPLGKPVLVNADLVMGRVPDPKHWIWDPRDGNGAVNENTCHVLDTVCYLLGDPVALHAFGGNVLGVGAPLEDAAAMSIKFAGGTAVALTGGGLAASSAIGIRTWLNVFTENGQALVTGTAHRYDTLTWATVDQKQPQTETWDYPPGMPLMQYSMQHFLDCVRSGEQPNCGVDAGLRTMALSMAVRQSIQNGGAVDVRWR